MDGGYLIHYGIKGQQHGVRRYQNKDGTWTEEGKLRRRVGNPKYVKPDGSLTDEGKTALRKARERNENLTEADRKEFGITNYQTKGGVLKKGDALYRATSGTIDLTSGKRKYFSTNPAENNAWIQMFGDQFANAGYRTYSLMYTPVKDLKVSSNAQLGKEFYERVLKNDVKNLDMNSLKQASQMYPIKPSVNVDKEGYEVYGSIASTLIGAQTRQGYKAVKAMLKAGYDAIPDVNGTDTSYDPIIVLNPKRNVKRVSTHKIPKHKISRGTTLDRWPLMAP